MLACLHFVRVACSSEGKKKGGKRERTRDAVTETVGVVLEEFTE